MVTKANEKVIVPRRGTGAPGPAMAAIPPRQRAFVRAMLETGGTNHARAAKMAGYGGNDNCIRVTAHRLAHDTKVLAALKEEADKRLRSGALLGASVLVEIASDNMHKDRFRAAESLLNRAGLIVATEHKVTVDRGTSERAMIDSITALSAQLGIDPKKLLGGYVEAEFTEVALNVPALPAAEDPTAGLEDIL